jgi:hypothetical protein
MYNFIVRTLIVVEQDSPQELASVSIVMFDRKEYSCMISANVGVKLVIVRFLTLPSSRTPVYPVGSCCATARDMMPDVSYLTLLCTTEALWFNGPRRTDTPDKMHAIYL